jgi:hypothetical protein
MRNKFNGIKVARIETRKMIKKKFKGNFLLILLTALRTHSGSFPLAG